MATFRNADEIQQEHLTTFGTDLGPLYHALYKDLVLLHAKWLEFRKLYAHSQERIDLLNEAAPFFFNVVQGVMWNDVLLHISRLTDPPEMRTYQQLTLLVLGEADLPEPLRGRVTEALELCKQQAAFARIIRNKHLAHRDLDHALGRMAEPLSMGSRADVEQVLSSFAALMNLVRKVFTNGEVAYRHFTAHGDGDDLAYCLRIAKTALAERDERLKCGQPLYGDLGLP